MAKCARRLILCTLLLSFVRPSLAVDARFDLVGPRINIRVTRNGVTLPVAEVPNLQPGDRIWLHPDLPPTQSVKYLLICVFLRGNTNPPPEDWFTRIETWQKDVREEGVFVTVPKEAQQAVLFLAPETGGDFSTLKSAVRGRPGIFVRASQDLAEAGFEQSRIEKYLADIRRVPPADGDKLQKHSDLLARTLALKPNEACFQQPVDMQFTCLTQTGSQSLLDDGHGQSIASALSYGPNSDLIAAASYTGLAGGGLYSAYVGAVVDLIRVMANLHTAQFQYIPAIAFPQNDAMNLRLNTPPSFHNPKSVLVIGLPAVQPSPAPPLRPADPNHVACLIEPSVTLPIEGAPLVFSTALAHDLVLHLNTPAGAPAEPDIPLIADAYHGGLVLQRNPEHHVPIHDVLHDQPTDGKDRKAAESGNAKSAKSQSEPIRLTGTIQGQWGFDSFTGPTVPLQQLPGSDWQIANGDASADGNLIAGKAAQLLITSTGSACVHTITAEARSSTGTQNITFKPAPTPEQPNLLALTLPLEKDITPGDLHFSIQQYGQPKADELSARTFAEPAHIDSMEIHAADRTVLLTGLRLNQVERLTLGDLNFKPLPPAAGDATEPAETSNSLRLALPADAPVPPTKVGDHLTAKVTLHDGRTLTLPATVSAPRPSVTLLSKDFQPAGSPAITLSSADDLPLSAPLTFTLKTAQAFPRSGRVEIETLDGALRSVLTLAPSGGLVLQDPHTVVATLDPLRAFGPSAFGALHFRAIFPPKKHADEQPAPNSAAEDDSSSDWLPLGTLVRLPQLSTLQCPPDPTAACTLSGSSLYLIDTIAPTPAFDDPAHVPDGYAGTTLTVPHPVSAGTLFLKLRDDPNPINAANVPSPNPAPRPATTARAHHPSSAAAALPSVPADTKPDSTKSDSTSPRQSDSTSPQAPEIRAHKDGGPQDDTNPTPASASPKD